MTTPPSLVIHILLAGVCLVLAVPWYIRTSGSEYSPRRLTVSLGGLLLVTLVLLHGLLVYGFLFGFGWSSGFGEGYGPALPLVVAEFVSVALFGSTLRSLLARSSWW